MKLSGAVYFNLWISPSPLTILKSHICYVFDMRDSKMSNSISKRREITIPLNDLLNDRRRDSVKRDQMKLQLQHCNPCFNCNYGSYFNNFSLGKSFFCIRLHSHHQPGLFNQLFCFTTLSFQKRWATLKRWAMSLIVRNYFRPSPEPNLECRTYKLQMINDPGREKFSVAKNWLIGSLPLCIQVVEGGADQTGGGGGGRPSMY